jgi:hypothetical protein
MIGKTIINNETMTTRRSRIAIIVLGLFVTMLCVINAPTCCVASDKWTGVDESVVEKIAEENGRVAHDPIINTDQGDLLLFVFLAAGVVGGFIGGYYWRVLTENKDVSNEVEIGRAAGE